MEAPHPGSPSRPRAMGPFAGALALALLAVAVGQEQLKGHSFQSPLDIRVLANDWFLAGTAIPTGSGVGLSPGVPQRVGLMWHKFPLLTNNFEVEFDFVDRGENPMSVSDSGFAFWYVYENATEAQMEVSKDHLHSQEHVTANLWMSAMRAKGFHLLGYRSQFDGLGVFFCNSNATEPGEVSRPATPVVSAILNEGIRPYKLWRGVPTRSAQQVDYRDGRDVTVNVRVEPASVTVKVNGGSEIKVSKPMKAGGFIGFTAHSGLKGSPDPKEKGDYVVFKRLAVKNYDTAGKGEEVPTLAPTVAPVPGNEPAKGDLLHETSAFKDHRGESEAIKELTNNVFKLVVESQPLRTEMMTAISSISKRMTAMEQSFKQLKADLDKSSGHKLDAEFDAMKKELVSLSQYASSETKAKNAKLDTLHADISNVQKASSVFGPEHVDRHLSKLGESNKRTLDNLEGEHKKMFGVSIAALAFIVIAGLSLYNKFRCWEKKHVM